MAAAPVVAAPEELQREQSHHCSFHFVSSVWI
jgi:hypothetical protein